MFDYLEDSMTEDTFMAVAMIEPSPMGLNPGEPGTVFVVCGRGEDQGLYGGHRWFTLISQWEFEWPDEKGSVSINDLKVCNETGKVIPFEKAPQLLAQGFGRRSTHWRYPLDLTHCSNSLRNPELSDVATISDPAGNRLQVNAPVTWAVRASTRLAPDGSPFEDLCDKIVKIEELTPRLSVTVPSKLSGGL